MLELSNNKASKARSCWMKYKFYAVDGLTPLRKSRAFTLGETVHSAFERLYKGDTQNTVLQGILDSYNSALKACPAEEEEDLRIDKFTALGMVEFYPMELHKFEECDPEVDFNVPLGWGVRLVGRIDGKVKQQGKFWVHELKTTSLALKQFEQMVENSYQPSGYKFAMEKKGSKCEGAIYDYLRKPRLYKRETDNADIFGRRIYADYALTAKDPKKRASYFGRVYVYRNDFQMDCFSKGMLALAKEIRHRTKKNDWPRNPDSCYMFNKTCEYAPICWKRTITDDLINAYFTKRGQTLQTAPVTEEITHGEVA